MRKLFAVTLSLQLILSPLAMAQTAASPEIKDEKSSANAGDQFRENPEAKAKGPSIAKQLMTMSAATVGTAAIFGCKFGGILPSLLIYSGGAVVYIASEIMGGKDHNNFLKKKASDLKMVEEKINKGGELQKAAIESALDSEKQTLKFINKRKMFATAIFAIYTAASIAALVEVLKIPIPFLFPPGQIGVCEPVSFVAKSALIPPAIAGAFSYLSGGGMIGTFGSMLILTVKPVAAAAAGVLNSAPGRAAFTAANAVMAMSVKSDMDKKAKIAEENIKKLEKVLATFNKDTTVSTAVATDGSGSASETASAGLNGSTSDPTSRAYALKDLPTDSNSSIKTCIGQSASGFDVSGSACASPVKFQNPKFDANLNVPTLSAATTLATDLGNAVAVGDSAKAEALAGELGNMAGRLSAVKKNLEKQVNDSLIAKGEKAIDFDKSASDQVASMQASIDKGLSTQGTSLAAIQGDAKLDPSAAAEGNGEIKDINAASSGETLALPAGTSPVITEGNLSGVETQNLEDKKTATLEEGLSEFESNENDINKDTDVSLFKQLSNRYILNYTKIFDKKEVKEKGP